MSALKLKLLLFDVFSGEYTDDGLSSSNISIGYLETSSEVVQEEPIDIDLVNSLFFPIIKLLNGAPPALSAVSDIEFMP